MSDELANCDRCGAALRPQAAFCHACGHFLLKTERSAVVPPLPVAKQNPLVALAGTFTKRRDPRSAPSPETLQQRRFMDLRSLAQLLDERELLPEAEAEYDRDIQPKKSEGSLSPLVYDGWRRHWKMLADAVYALRGRLGDQPAAPWDSNDQETWTNEQPAWVALRGSLRAGLDAVVAQLGRNQGDMRELVRFEIRLQASISALRHLAAQLETLRLGEALAALGWVRDLLDGGIRDRGKVDDLDALLALSKKIQAQYGDHRNRLHEDAAKGLAAAGLFDGVERDLARLVEIDQDFYLGAQAWMKQVVHRLPDSVPGLRDKVLRADHNEGRALLASMDRALASLITDFVEQGRQCGSALVEEDADARRARAERARSESAAQMQADMLSELLTRQQVLRQQSEGKFGLALTTQVFGAETGALWEGLLK